jgi:hypothetical protein
MTKRLTQTTLTRVAIHEISLLDSVLPFAIGFVTSNGEVVGTCLKFAVGASITTTVHLNTAQTAALICSLTDLRSDERAGWIAAMDDEAGKELSLAQREIDTVRMTTVARLVHVSAEENGVAIRFDLMTGKYVNVRMTGASADRWLKRMDASISQLELLRDATAANC